MRIERSIRHAAAWLALTLAATAGATAETGTASDGRTERIADPAFAVERMGDSDAAGRRWTVNIDNDWFAFTDHDRDYTAGVSFALSGSAAHHHPLSLARLLETTDRATRFDRLERGARSLDEAFELGLLLFTPQDLAAEQALPDDRPYASLLYAASSQLAIDEQRGVAFQSSLALGFLGLPFAERLHQGIHEIFGSAMPRGYDHQISDGGEPTFMYAASRYALLRAGTHRGHEYSLRLATGVSAGYVTEANLEIAARRDIPWWASSSASADYAGHPPIAGPAPAHDDGRPRLQLEAGAKLHARVYNAFLQGQFRHSDVAFASSELNPLLLDLWVGATTVLANGLAVSYTVHRQTEEIEAGSGARNFTWASIGIAQQF